MSDSQIDLHLFLARTSRTFALAIPMLPEPLRRSVMVAYLVFRVADTLEDADLWSREQRVRALTDLGDLLGDPTPARAAALARHWTAQPPCEHDGYVELLGALPGLLGALTDEAAAHRELVCAHVRRSAQGMAAFVSRMAESGGLVLDDTDDLRRYCYAVAGIVGELLTELFLHTDPRLEPIAPTLRRHGATFGEALQLVNILKDAADDERQGRVYLPPAVDRRVVFALARADLDVAATYIGALHGAGAARGVVAFTSLTVLLARATLDRVRSDGAGAKVSRSDVAKIVYELERALDEGRVPVA